MSDQNKRNVKLGIFIFAGLLFFVVGVLAIGNINKTFTKTVTISSVFNEVSGLQSGDNVWFSGVKVGTVKDLRFIENANVEVTMKIEAKSRAYIPKNAKAKISSDGLIGSKIIVIYGGSISAGHIETGDQLAFEPSNSTDEMMHMLQENNKNLLAITNDFKLITKKIVDGNGTIGKLLSDETTYDELNKILITFQQAANHAENLTASIDQFTTKLNSEGGLANDLATDTIVFQRIQASVEELNAITQTASEIAENLKTTTSEINTNQNSPVGVMLHDQQAAESLKLSIQNLESSTEKLNESMEALQHNFLLRGFFKKKNKEDSGQQ